MDRSVVKFYRAWERVSGADQPILATYAQARIVECLTVEENFYQNIEHTLDKYNDPAPEDIEEGPEEGEV
ncbi:hypothetical protein [uncultured Litoreibacter sp.]|uniref:hypothetical protein n=1 Tax=uncultured Litoreibacter sp. TaxID=1392394 RepID=UPI002615B334|nr:hypothetical protein [uncultured Litoreibacter sp.]